MSGARFHDRRGLPVSTPSAIAVERYAEGVDRLLSLNAGADASLELALAADEGFALAHAALALMRQIQGRADDARACAIRARELVAGATPRERRHVEAIAAAVTGESRRATGLVREHLAEFPRDALVLYQCTGLISGSGRPDRDRERFAAVHDVAGAYGDDWWFLGVYGFAHHELERFAESQRLSERSLERYPRNAGATHNIAHVAYETCDNDPGAAFLAGWLADYEQHAPYHCHLSWHLALFELAQGHYDRAMQIYDRAISPAVTRERITLMDASSFLWRWQMYGCGEAALPWRDVCDFAGRIVPKPGYAFGDVHAALAYAAAGDDAAINRLIDGVRDLAAKGNALMGEVALPLVQGVAAFSRADYGEAVRLLEPIKDDIHRVGGSHAQWEVFEETLVEAYLRAGRFDQAEDLLRRRLGRRPSARDYFWLGRAQIGAGNTGAATSHLQQARERWQTAEPAAPEQVALARASAAP